MLGQFDPFHDPSGRLLLVAPNIVHVERELGVDPTDFRLWVCLHEETHRVQFTAVPWMRDHLYSEMMALTDSVEPTRLAEDAVRRISEAVRGWRRQPDGRDEHARAARDPGPDHRRDVAARGPRRRRDGRRRPDRDPVGRQDPEVFNERRKGIGTLDRILRRLLGLDAKMAQYRDGAAFVNHVVDKVGMEQFNAVWAGPENLPSKSEIGDPDAWITRVAVTLHPSLAAVRRGVRAVLDPLDPGAAVVVACSGGADSLALLSATIFEGHKRSLRVVGVTVDHGLQPGSADHAARVVAQMAAMGADETLTATVTVAATGVGPEAAARQARYAVLEEIAERLDAASSCSATPSTTRPRPCCSA